MNNYLIKHKKVYCTNCGKYDHTYKNCNDPITSNGLITFKLDIENIKIKKNFDYDKFIHQFTDEYQIDLDEQDTHENKQFDENTYINNMNKKFIHIEKINNENYNMIKYINLFKNDIKFLMIRRRNSLGFLEFIRGKYEIDTQYNDQHDSIYSLDHLTSLFEQMTYDEIDIIKNKTFDEIWFELVNITHFNNIFEKDYQQSKEKFNKLKNSTDIHNLSFYTNIKPLFNIAEWGFPKGRRNCKEKNIYCARREFNEETNFTNDEYTILNRINPLNEVFAGTNGVFYKHIYFIGTTNTNKTVDLTNPNKNQLIEIGDIGWFTFNECMQMIRPYHTQRKLLLTEIFLFIINSIMLN